VFDYGRHDADAPKPDDTAQWKAFEGLRHSLQVRQPHASQTGSWTSGSRTTERVPRKRRPLRHFAIIEVENITQSWVRKSTAAIRQSQE